MIYSSQRAQAIQKKDIAFLSAGIHDDVVLDSIRVDKSINGNNFVEFKFVSKDGKFMTHTEWEPAKLDSMTNEDLQKKCDNQFSRIDQILQCFYPNAEDRVFNGENFVEFINWVAEKLNNADKSITLRLKVVYNNSGYTTLPKYAKYRFIEPMTIVNNNESVIVKLNIDNFEKPVIADNEQSNPNPLTSNSSFTVVNGTLDTTNSNSNDLPF